jgi:hypothetical protein
MSNVVKVSGASKPVSIAVKVLLWSKTDPTTYRYGLLKTRTANLVQVRFFRFSRRRKMQNSEEKKSSFRISSNQTLLLVFIVICGYSEVTPTRGN